MSPEAFDGWTPEGLGIALRMDEGDLAHAPRRRRWLRWLLIGIGSMVLLGCLASGVAALMAWRWPRDRRGT